MFLLTVIGRKAQTARRICFVEVSCGLKLMWLSESFRTSISVMVWGVGRAELGDPGSVTCGQY